MMLTSNERASAMRFFKTGVILGIVLGCIILIVFGIVRSCS